MPMWDAVLGGVASALPGLLGSDSASDKQATTARKQLKLAKKQWKAQEGLLTDQYGDQIKDVDAVRGRNLGQASAAYQKQTALARNLRDTGRTLASTTAAGNRKVALDALTAQSDFLRQGRDAAIGSVSRAGSSAIGDLRQGRDASLAAVRTGASGAIRDLESARDASIAGFEPAARLGNDALSAYAFNLGIGGKPKGYAGLGFTEGDKFLLNEGVTDIQGSAAARGTLESGATLEALEKMRAGLAATRRDQSQSELFGLGQLGQTATGNIANLRTGAARDIAGVRTGLGDDIANLYTGAARDVAGVRTGTAGDVANLYASTGRDLAGARSDYATRSMGINDANYARRYGVESDYAAGAGSALDALTNRNMTADQNWLAGRGGARDARATGMGNASQTYQSNALGALANRGDALAAGAVGQANAIQNGINTGLGIWAMNRNPGYEDYRSQMPNGGTVTGPLGRSAGMATQGNALSGIGNWVGNLFGRVA